MYFFNDSIFVQMRPPQKRKIESKLDFLIAFNILAE